jgi:hypothetical protein
VVGAAVQGLSHVDDHRPDELAPFERWQGRPVPERIEPNTPGWSRWTLHNAANPTLWVPRTVSRLLTSAFVVAQAPRLPAIADQHDRSLWPSDSPTSCSDAC